MAKTINEIEVLRFFEEGPAEKAEVVYNIVSEKMRQRFGRNRNEGSRSKAKDAARKQRETSTTELGLPGTSESEPSA